jgi:group I intron endonuclease
MRSKITGIYAITCGDRVYIGQSVNIYRRWQEHKLLLRKDKHYNTFLQNIYNKHGKDAVSFKIVQIINSDLLSKLQISEIIKLLKIVEQTWINLVNSDINMRCAAGSPLGTKTSEETRAKLSQALSKPYAVISPEGEKIEGKNFLKFCESKDLNLPAMHDVVNLKRLHHKGWTANLKFHELYKTCFQERGVNQHNQRGYWSVNWTTDTGRKQKDFKTREEAIKYRDLLHSLGYNFKVCCPNWKDKRP